MPGSKKWVRNKSVSWADNKNKGGKGQEKWKADCEELEKFVFTIGDHAADRFNKTLEKVLSYVTANCTHGNDITRSLRGLKHIDLVKESPPEPDNLRKSKVARELFRCQIKSYSERLEKHKTNKQKVFALILGQCHPSLKTRLKAQIPDWTGFVQVTDPVELLKYVKEQTHNVQSYKFPLLCQREAMEDVFGGLKQKEGESLPAFKERYQAQVETMESLGVKPQVSEFIKKLQEYKKAEKMALAEHIIKLEEKGRVMNPPEGDDDSVPDYDWEHNRFTQVSVMMSHLSMEDITPKMKNVKALEEKWYNKLIALNFLNALNKHGKYAELLNDLQNSWSDGRDEFPADLDAAMAKATAYRALGGARTKGGKGPNSGSKRKGGAGTQDVNAAQPEGGPPKKQKVKCWICNGDHVKADCPFNPQSDNYNPKLLSKVTAFQQKAGTEDGDSGETTKQE